MVSCSNIPVRAEVAAVLSPLLPYHAQHNRFWTGHQHAALPQCSVIRPETVAIILQ